MDSIKYVCFTGFCAIIVQYYSLLVNAASKGHLPVVLYLLSKLSANPLIRNNWGETAFDVAAAVFEIWICEVRLYQFPQASALTCPFRFCYEQKKKSGLGRLGPMTH